MIPQFEISKNFGLDVHEITVMKVKRLNILKISMSTLTTSVEKSDDTEILKIFPSFKSMIDK